MVGEVIKKSPKDTFDTWYPLAVIYYNEHGNLLVPRNYVTKNGEYLGNWIIYMRYLYNSKNSIISLEKVKKLEAIGMIWQVNDYRWNLAFNKIKAYYDTFNSLDIPPEYNNGEGKKLTHWLKEQRNIYYSRNRSKKDLEKIIKLESIGLICHHKDELWDNMYLTALIYYKEHKNLLVPINYETKDNKKLGIWVRNQRKAYFEGILSSNRINLLEQIDMVWDVYETRWNLMYKEAINYYKKYHTLNLSKDFKSPETTRQELQIWLSNQKRYYNKNKILSKSQREKLEKIDINHDYSEDTWQFMYNLAYNYYLENNHLLIPRKYKINGYNLGLWLETRHCEYQNGTLSSEKIRKLEAIGIIWTPRKNLSDIYEYLDINHPEIDKKLNRDVLRRISLTELIAKINYLKDVYNLPPIDNTGHLLKIFSMSSIALKEQYGLSLEEMINKYNIQKSNETLLKKFKTLN